MRRLSAHLAIAVAILLVAGCSNRTAGGSGSSEPTTPKEVVLFGAASTGDALDEVRTAYRSQARTDVLANYAATSTLAQQVLSGAPADVFVSANPRWADRIGRRISPGFALAWCRIGSRKLSGWCDEPRHQSWSSRNRGETS